MAQDEVRPSVEGVILLVDDDALTRDFLRDTLSEHYIIRFARNGIEALDILQSEQIDLVLLDINMPVMDGFTVLQKIRTQYDQTRLPVIILSVVADTDNIIRGLDLGANDYLPQPVNPLIVRARVRTQLLIKKLTDDHEETIQQLETTETIRKRFSQIASHDLKNPLNNLRIVHTLLEEALEGNDKYKPLVDSINMNVEAMRHIIDDFLDIVNIQTNNIALKLQTISLRDVIINVLTQYEITAEDKEITLDYGNIQGLARGDQARMIQVVSNLVSNAIKYSTRGSTVNIYVETVDGEQIIHVIDRGMGVPEAERHMLFDEFSKLSTRPTEGEESTGLGLWIVKLLMERQNGRTGATFPESGGSDFWVALPEVDLKTDSDAAPAIVEPQ